MKFKVFVLLMLAVNIANAQKTAQDVIKKYLEVTNISKSSATITDMVMSITTETPRGVSETETKIAFPFKYSTSMFSNGMELMSTKFDGETMVMKSNWGNNNQEPKKGKEAITESARLNPFVEMEYEKLGFTLALLPQETIDGKTYDVVEIKDADGKVSKDYFNTATGLKDRTSMSRTSPRGTIEIVAIFEDYKAFKGSDILLPVVRKQKTQMGEISSELQSVKFNKGLKPKEFEIK
ncbi:MAG: hypothetical protein IPH28_18145 [Cytophagaceae bacterium]|nr:hypothetical protein [Cytophagaceae bacterium]MBK9936188.1 hypothetical protein [Cytophagaceae bacterium]MBL0303923.1 hypothetical protein [Cytophagaceae bacterium]MBL0326736.1 hypothetical protein [Cytophagaceae bacterium]